VAQLCDRVAVMYAGRIVETAPVVALLQHPRHPYSQGLIASVPQAGGERTALRSIEGTPPSLLNLPPGCSFNPRCPYSTDICRQQIPPLTPLPENRQVACHHHQRIQARLEEA